MSDLISRQAAIDAVLSVIPYDEYWKEQIEKVVSNLPSAQPELIEKAAYIRGFEQGRTQGMIDAQGGKK